MRTTGFALVAVMAGCLLSFPGAAQEQGEQSGQQQAQEEPQEPMGFFVTSAVPQTGNLGGLEGADQICQDLAAAAGAADREWRAYLSTQEVNGHPAVNARDRIGNGPWHNAKGVLIAATVADLHGDDQRDRNNLYKDTAIDENGNLVNGRGDEPNQHDILTGSDSHGRAFPAGEDRTCQNWTSDSPDARGWVGHHDRQGGGNTSWNHVHATRGGCHVEGLADTGGNGRFYCFAAD